MPDSSKKYKTLWFPGIFILFIFVVSVFFRIPIQIVDALSGTAAEGFGIHISIWRILFEPFLGPLLFYLRADQPLVEILVLLLWLIIALLFFLIIKNIRSTPTSPFRALWQGFKAWLVRFPIVLITGIAVMILIIFVPLPSNTIINNNKNAVLINLHSHSHYSHDGIISHDKLMRWHKRNGFDAFFLTEHNNHNKTLELVKAQRSGSTPSSPLVLCGQEYSGSNHILLLGLKRNFNTKDYPDSTAIDSVQAQGGCAVIAHWFADKRKSIQHYIDIGAEGFEIANQAEGIFYDPQVIEDIIKHCKSNGLLMLGDCDYHGYGSAAFAWNAFTIPGWHNKQDSEKRKEIMEILRHHDQEKITVLLYRDRRMVPREKVWASPITNLFGYFRSLTIWQILSWSLWILLFWYFLSTDIIRNKINPFRKNKPHKFWGSIGFVSACIPFIKGIHLLSKAGPLEGYNEIFKEYGIYFSIIGALFIVYGVLLYYYDKFTKRKIA